MRQDKEGNFWRPRSLGGSQLSVTPLPQHRPGRSSGSQPRAASSRSYCCQQRALGLGQGWGCEEPPSGSAARTAFPPSPALRAYAHLGQLLASPTFKAASISPSPARGVFKQKAGEDGSARGGSAAGSRQLLPGPARAPTRSPLPAAPGGRRSRCRRCPRSVPARPQVPVPVPVPVRARRAAHGRRRRGGPREEVRGQRRPGAPASSGSGSELEQLT